VTKADETRAIYERYRPWFLRYRAGAPAGYLAAIVQHESGGRPDARGDASLGEQGLFQTEGSFGAKIGLPGLNTLNPEIAIFAGGLEMALRAIEMLPYADLGTSDSYRLARLGFAIGSGGTRKVIDAATGGNPGAYRGQVFARVLEWANRTGAIAVSSGQPAEKVRARINAVQEQWDIGQRINGAYGMPEKVPAPSGLRYTLPASAARHLASPRTGIVLALGAVAGLTLYLLTRKDADAPEHPAAS
jgi:hypothetical protein